MQHVLTKREEVNQAHELQEDMNLVVGANWARHHGKRAFQSIAEKEDERKKEALKLHSLKDINVQFARKIARYELNESRFMNAFKKQAQETRVQIKRISLRKSKALQEASPEEVDVSGETEESQEPLRQPTPRVEKLPDEPGTRTSRGLRKI